MAPYSVYQRDGFDVVYIHQLRDIEMSDGGIVAAANGELAGMQFACVNQAALEETLAWLAEKGYK